MRSDKRIITINGEEREYAEKLGLDIPVRKEIRTKILFWKKDVSWATITEEGHILVVTQDDNWIEMEYEEKMWKELEMHFKKNEV